MESRADRTIAGQERRVHLHLSPRVSTRRCARETIGEVLSVMKALADEGMTMVVVTHEMTFARHVGDWVAVFDAGRIVEQGPPAQIFDAPTTERTRDFLSHLGWAG
jgi:polar amino acid transport system ATP-binding protein